MDIVYLQTPLFDYELEVLKKEFPQYRFLVENSKEIPPEEWKGIEILYGSRIKQDQLTNATNLRWIHSPALDLVNLPLKEISQHGNILVTNVGEENFLQIGEFVTAGIMAFAKNLFYWFEKGPTKVLVEYPARNTVWSLKNRILLQIGLGKAGCEIAKRAKQLGMRVWGLQSNKSFHPDCHETFNEKDLHTILPAADVVSICLPWEQVRENVFDKAELELLKDDALLISIGPYNIVNEESLSNVASRLRGVLLDISSNPSLSKDSPLWRIPNILITPQIASFPESVIRQSFHIFHYNMRQYVHGDFKDMRHCIIV
jgi:D-2-hydroxyacid dehydrogenase (NADP+)